ncbi:hypothetical protein [Phenylobacterium sp.]|uniref:hypothetical protein n=1 Tax=Phenylobacterium sp. TaxID=1871053 RepID=UPI002F92C33C
MAPTRVVGSEGQPDPRGVRDVIRAEANRLYPECGRVVLPDRAFEPVEITGGGHPEYVVMFGRGLCESVGTSQNWQGTGGAVIQVWLASGGPPRMLMERQVMGFSVVPRGLITHQHGSYCPGGAGPAICQVTYEWHENDRALYPTHRQFFDGTQRVGPRTMDWDYEQVSR